MLGIVNECLRTVKDRLRIVADRLRIAEDRFRIAKDFSRTVNLIQSLITKKIFTCNIPPVINSTASHLLMNEVRKRLKRVLAKFRAAAAVKISKNFGAGRVDAHTGVFLCKLLRGAVNNHS